MYKRQVITFSGCPRFSAARDVFDVLRQVEAREVYETAHRMRSIIGQVLTIAIDIHVSSVTSNPAAGLARVLKKPEKMLMAAIIYPKELGRLLRDIGSFVVKSAFEVAPIFFVRPMELCPDIDFDGLVLNIPAAAMKMKRSEKSQMGTQPHAVSLPRQVDEVLRKQKQVTGRGAYVFAIRSGSRPISANTVNVGLRTLAWDADTVTGHGR